MESFERTIWNNVSQKAQEYVRKGQIQNSYLPRIELLVEPTFDNPIFLQLEIKGEQVHWYHTTWLKTLDSIKLLNPVESLKYVGKEIAPTMVYAKGEIGLEVIAPILARIRGLVVPPKIDKVGAIVLDGVYYTLTIGVESMQTTYKWHYLPDEWLALGKVADMLVALYKELS